MSGTLPVTNGGSPFNQANGTIFERLQTQDLLLGSNATSSAKFAFINNATGTPTASISANNGNNATYLTGNGVLGTTNGQTLTLGSTGNINFFSSANVLDTLGNLSLAGNGTFAGTTGLTLTGNGAGLAFSGSGNHTISATSGTLQLGAATLTGTITGNNQNISGIGNISANTSANTITGFGTIGTTGTTNFNGLTLTLTGGGNPDITSTANNNLTIAPNGSGNTVLSSDFNSGVLIGSGSNTLAPLSVSGGIGGNAATIINQTNSGDIFTASASGATKFTIANNGNLQIYGSQTTPVTLTSNATAPQTIALPNATGTICLEGSASCGFSVGANYWQLNNNAISPSNSTFDVLIGSTATSSAQFGITGVATGAPTATLSAATNGNGISLVANSATIQS